MYWYSPSMGYHEHDPIYPDDFAVDRRPDPTYELTGTSWVATSTTAILSAEAKCAALIVGGLNITSTSTPALDGVYALDNEGNMAGTQAAIVANVFVGWYRRADGTRVTMTAAQCTSIMSACYQFIAACEDALGTVKSGGTPTWPSNAVTIP